MLVMLNLENALAIFYAVLFGIPLLYALYILIRTVRVVGKKQAMIIERLGKFHKVCGPGLHFLIPFVDFPRVFRWRDVRTSKSSGYGYGQPQETFVVKQWTSDYIDLRENIMDFPSQPIITRDNVEIIVHPMVLYKIIDPMRVVYETYDISHAVEKIVQTTLRALIGDMGMDDTLASREEINRALKTRVEKIVRNWGVSILRVELLEITPTASVQTAMNRQLEAERVRRAAIVQADGYRLQTKMIAEGNCEAIKARSTGQMQVRKLKAKGASDARILVAEAEAKAITVISEALQGFGVDVTQYIIGLKYIETFKNVAINAAKRVVYLPYETDVVGAASTIGQKEE